MDTQQAAAGQWLQVTITGEAALLDALADYLMGAFAAAVEISVDQPRLQAFLAAPPVSGRLRLLAQIEQYSQETAAIFDVAPPQISWQILADQDWGSSWKEHFHPFSLIPGLVIAPTWEEYIAEPGEQVIVMDPGMAFGTGHHATTSLCAGMVREAVRRGGVATVLDVGTGTGVLAMTAALAGARRVLGIDNDPLAVTAATANVAVNGLTERVTISGEEVAAVDGEYELVAANIVHDVLIELAAQLSRLTAAGGALVLSGILLDRQLDSIRRHFMNLGYCEVQAEEEGEWAALWLTKCR